MKSPRKPQITGIITARDCPSCGHHEIGVITEDGTFFPLRPGTWIQVLGDMPAQSSLSTGTNQEPLEISPDKEEKVPGKVPWAPPHTKKFRSLSLKYGIMIPEDQKSVPMNHEIFEKAYLQKIRHLIEKEKDQPLPVILDQFFAAPHLATGTPEEIALNMWNELEEIREPAEKIGQWLDSPESELPGWMPPESEEKPLERDMKDSDLSEELEKMTLEEFLDLF
jgi:hypothetical protein